MLEELVACVDNEAIGVGLGEQSLVAVDEAGTVENVDYVVEFATACGERKLRIRPKFRACSRAFSRLTRNSVRLFWWSDIPGSESMTRQRSRSVTLWITWRKPMNGALSLLGKVTLTRSSGSPKFVIEAIALMENSSWRIKLLVGSVEVRERFIIAQRLIIILAARRCIFHRPDAGHLSS